MPGRSTTSKVAAPKKPAAKKKTGARPTPAQEARFWALIEDAWATQSAKANKQRKALATRDPDADDEPDAALVDEALEAVIEQLEATLRKMDQASLVAFDLVLERKLYDIDRQEIQEVTDGSDDGFLYCRGYIVALGQAFYDAVNENPAVALVDAECSEMCYLASHIHEQRFGGWPDTGSGISRESCSNSSGWRE